MKNILNKFTLRSLKLNKKRTIATCIGIILSTALICAVAGVFSSFQETLLENARKNNGDYHVIFKDVPTSEQKYITENRNVKSYCITQGVGYSRLNDSNNKYKPYLYLMEFDENALNSLGLSLEKGRMPQNENELLISKHIEENGGVKYKVGDKITLNLGQRTINNEELNQNNPFIEAEDGNEGEHLKLTGETREFTVVGIIKRPNMKVENYSAPGYTIITTLNKTQNRPANIIVKFNNIRDTYKLVREIAEDKKQTSKSSDNSETWVSKYDFQVNEELLRWSGVARSDDTMKMFYSLAGIVIAIIVGSSVFVIRNSFAISITEKMKQYGMFSSIGATKKQIRRNVLFEGMILGLISIPIGIACGVLATYILIKVTTVLIGSYAFSNDTEFIFNMPVVVVAVSALLGFVTIYLSCIFSARKAAKISPLEAIRSNEDIKIKAKKIKSPKFIKKFFGMGGEIAYKNLKRNRKKYRTTVISLVVSITVFISLSSFMKYAFNTFGTYYYEMDYNVYLSLHYSNSENNEKESKRAYDYFQEVAKKYQLKDYNINRCIYVNTDLSDAFTEDYKKAHNGEKINANLITLKSVGEDKYREYVKKIGAKYEDCKDGIIYYNNSSEIYGEEEKYVKVVDIKQNFEINGTQSQKDTPINLKVVQVANKGISESSEHLETEFGEFIISDELMDKIGGFSCQVMTINAKDPNGLCKKMTEEKKELEDSGDASLYIANFQEQAEEEKKMVLLISIFLYGFITVISLIGVTNIFNTITTNMNLRSKEFAMLKSIGMTKKEFNKMIRLESIFYGVKSLIIGCLLGLILSFCMFKVIIDARITSDMLFVFPIEAIVISVIFIGIIVGIIMRYSLNKINKQNIIETIRKDNI